MDAAHREIADLIPWYANGTLSGDERAGLEKHLNECLPCRAALRGERRIRGLVRGQDDVPLSAEHGFSDLLRRIDANDGRAAPFRLGPRFAWGAAIVGAAIFGWLLVSGPLTPEAGDAAAPFMTQTDGTSTGVNRIDIIFADTIDEAEILGIIEFPGARIVGGPSELGRYTVTIADSSEDELSQLIDRLSEDPRVRFVGRNYTASPSVEVESQ